MMCWHILKWANYSFCAYLHVLTIRANGSICMHLWNFTIITWSITPNLYFLIPSHVLRFNTRILSDVINFNYDKNSETSIQLYNNKTYFKNIIFTFIIYFVSLGMSAWLCLCAGLVVGQQHSWVSSFPLSHRSPRLNSISGLQA